METSITISATWTTRSSSSSCCCSGSGSSEKSARLDSRAVAPIPLVDVRAQYEPLIPELLERFRAVLVSGELILGPNVAAFEEEAARALGVSQTIGVAHGTDAIVLVLDALGI